MFTIAHPCTNHTGHRFHNNAACWLIRHLYTSPRQGIITHLQRHRDIPTPRTCDVITTRQRSDFPFTITTRQRHAHMKRRNDNNATPRHAPASQKRHPLVQIMLTLLVTVLNNSCRIRVTDTAPIALPVPVTSQPHDTVCPATHLYIKRSTNAYRR